MAKNKKAEQVKQSDPQIKLYDELMEYLDDNNARINNIIWIGGIGYYVTDNFRDFTEMNSIEKLEKIFGIEMNEDNDCDDYMEAEDVIDKLMNMGMTGFVIELHTDVRDYYEHDSYGSSPGHSYIDYIYSNTFGIDMFEKIKKCINKSVERDKAKLSKNKGKEV